MALRTVRSLGTGATSAATTPGQTSADSETRPDLTIRVVPGSVTSHRPNLRGNPGEPHWQAFKQWQAASSCTPSWFLDVSAGTGEGIFAAKSLASISGDCGALQPRVLEPHRTRHFASMSAVSDTVQAGSGACGNAAGSSRERQECLCAEGATKRSSSPALATFVLVV